MRKGLLRTIISMIFIVALLAVGINFDIYAGETDIVLEEDSITLYAGTGATEEDQYYQFTLKGKGLAISPCVWRLSDDTYLTVDDKGLVRLKDNIPKNIDIPSITLTVCNETTNESDTALIFIETDPPLGSVIMTKSMYKDIYVESTLNPVVVTLYTEPAMTRDMFKDQYVEPSLNPVVVTINTKPVMTRDMFKDQYVEPTLNPVVVTYNTKPVMTRDMFKNQYVEPTLEPVITRSTRKDLLSVPTSSYEFFIKFEEEFLSN